MSEIAALTDKYIHLRREKMTATAALELMKPEVERLTVTERAELAKNIRTWEESQKAKPVIQPLSSNSASKLPSPPPKPVSAPPQQQAVCAHCGNINPPSEMFCLKCGWPVQLTKRADKTMLLDPQKATADSSFFGPTYTLLLLVKDSRQVIRRQPADMDHEVIIGRASEESIIAPDIDLAAHGAAGLGVSRAHIALRYDAARNALTVSDLDSANGSYVNDVRLHPNDVRVLRHGDEIRLGMLTLEVIFERG